jgi:hypothetical protein
MREIKFRAWDGEKYLNEVNISNSGRMIDLCGWVYNGQFDYPIEQYTGLKDWYKNDIIRSDHFEESNGKKHYLYHQIIWSDKYMGWFMKNCGSDNIESNGNIQMFVYLRSSINPTKCGNIHETPEIIKCHE